MAVDLDGLELHHQVARLGRRLDVPQRFHRKARQVQADAGRALKQLGRLGHGGRRPHAALGRRELQRPLGLEAEVLAGPGGDVLGALPALQRLRVAGRRVVPRHLHAQRLAHGLPL